MSRYIFNPHVRSSEKSLLLVSFNVFLFSIAVILFIIISSPLRVCDFFVLRVSVFHLTLCDTHICLHSIIHILSTNLSFSLSLYLLPFSRFLVCTIWQCVLQILWIWLGTNNRVFSKKGTIFVKRNSLARDTLILFSAKHTDLYRVEKIGDKGSIRRIFFLWPVNFLFRRILIYLSKFFFLHRRCTFEAEAASCSLRKVWLCEYLKF